MHSEVTCLSVRDVSPRRRAPRAAAAERLAPLRARHRAQGRPQRAAFPADAAHSASVAADDGLYECTRVGTNVPLTSQLFRNLYNDMNSASRHNNKPSAKTQSLWYSAL